MSCPALQLEKTSQSKRNRFSQKHRREGQRLAELLRQQRESFPSFAEQIDQLIDKVTLHAQRTRQSDREKVLSLLTDWHEGLGWRDIMEDTGMSRWDVRKILESLIADGLVIEVREPLPEVRSVWWRRIYKLKRK